MTSQGKKKDPYIQGLITGDERILKEIYSKYSLAITEFVQRYNGTREDARDVMQEGLIIVYKKVQQPDFTLKSSFFTFFYAVCRNVWLKILSRKKLKTVTIEGNLGLIDDANVVQALSLIHI